MFDDGVYFSFPQIDKDAEDTNTKKKMVLEEEGRLGWWEQETNQREYRRMRDE